MGFSDVWWCSIYAHAPFPVSIVQSMCWCSCSYKGPQMDVVNILQHVFVSENKKGGSSSELYP